MNGSLMPSMTAEQLLAGWRPRRVGRRIAIFAEVGSTNTVALEAAEEPEADGLVVLADYQTAGRGRQGRSWLSPRRAGVLGSVLLLMDPPVNSGAGEESQGLHWSTSVGGRLTLISAVAACAAIRRATEITPAIKWPNDLRVGERKLGGILIECRRTAGGVLGAWVIGIGINCHQQRGHFPPELAETATSLDLLASHPIDHVAVARELLRCLDELLADPADPGDEELHAQWLRYAEPIGRRVRLRCDGQEYSGRTVAVEPRGGLIVQCDGGTQKWFDPLLTTLL